MKIYTALVSGLFFAAIVYGFAMSGAPSTEERTTALAFLLAALAADVFMVRFNSHLSFSLSLPIVLAAGMILHPPSAAVVGFLSTADISDLRGRLPFLRALFNRSQIGLSTLAASAVFHSLGGLGLGWPLLMVPAAAAVSVDGVVNTAFVAWSTSRLQVIGVPATLRQMFGPRIRDSVLRYVAVGLMAPLIATMWLVAGVWGLLAFLLPVALAWSASAKARELDLASERLELKDDALAESLDKIADERRDERLVLVGELHDEVLPALYKVHLMGQVIRKDFESGQLLQLEEDVPELADAVSFAQLSIRRVMSNLRDSGIGADGLASTIESCARSLETASTVRFSLDLAEVKATSSCQLVVFQAAREAMRNAVQHSKSDSVSVRLWQDRGWVRLAVHDDGVGFDHQQARKSMHFGLDLIGERAEALGGRLVIDSVLGRGTSISLSMPPDA